MTAAEQIIETFLSKARQAAGEITLACVRYERRYGQRSPERERLCQLLHTVNIVTDPYTEATTEEKLALIRTVTALADLHGYSGTGLGCAIQSCAIQIVLGGSPGGGISLPLSGAQVIVNFNGQVRNVQVALNLLYGMLQGQNIVKISGGTF